MHATLTKKLLCAAALTLTPFVVYAGGTNTEDKATTGYQNAPDRSTQQGDMGKGAGSGSVAKVSDSDLEDRVEKAIENDAQLRNIDIDVEAENGVVKLTGDVSDIRWKGRATKVASSVQGVKSVRNELSVKD
jgi:hyperosmotically inducible protein